MSRKDWRTEAINQMKFNMHENYDFANGYFKQNQDNTDMFRYTYQSELKPVYECNNIEPINNNTQLLENVVQLIRKAEKFIHYETYIICDGFFLRTVIAELIKKAETGVKVRFLYDWMGGLLRIKKRQIKELKRHGVEVGIFNPPGFNIFKGSTNYRLHRKALIIDNRYALYGGSNLGDEYLSMDSSKNYWRDQNFILEGEIVNSINISFINDWINFTDYSVSSTQKNDLVKNLGEYLVIYKTTTNNNLMQFCTNTPNYLEKGIMNTMALMILRARKSIKLVTPYFIPTELCSSALNIAARSGVNVEIIVPGKPDNKNFILIVNRSQYPELLKTHCKIYEYNGFIHSKYLIIDDKYVLVTTANFDYRSFWNNFESGVLIQSTKFSEQMCQIFADEINNSILITDEMSKNFITFTSRLRLMIFALYKPLL